MRYYLDTEFSERPCTIELISIGIVREDGLELYCVSGEFDDSRLNDWVRANVIPNLNHPDDLVKGHLHQVIDASGVHVAPVPYDTREEIAKKVREFIGSDPRPVIYGYYADYDWVVFCWLFGAMVNLPKGWPMYCRDLKQMVDEVWDRTGIDLRKQVTQDGKHNALSDARFNKRLHDKLLAHASGQLG